jgi:hypothetical protein
MNLIYGEDLWRRGWLVGRLGALGPALGAAQAKDDGANDKNSFFHTQDIT